MNSGNAFFKPYRPPVRPHPFRWPGFFLLHTILAIFAVFIFGRYGYAMLFCFLPFWSLSNLAYAERVPLSYRGRA